MSDHSRLPEIIDASAAVARRITGVAVDFGVGSGLVIDIYTGLAVPAAPSNVLEIGPGVHVSRWPQSVSIRWLSATVCELTWPIPMELSVIGPDEPTLLANAIPFVAAYVEQFAQYAQLADSHGPRCNSALITASQPLADPPRIRFTLTAVERLNFDVTPGGTV